VGLGFKLYHYRGAWNLATVILAYSNFNITATNTDAAGNIRGFSPPSEAKSDMQALAMFSTMVSLLVAGTASMSVDDSGEHIVNTTKPTTDGFTVFGLKGKSDTVPIGSNGTYSADLSNLANGTLTYLMTASDPVGNVINVDPTVTLGDGSANAPAGPAQLPNLLSGYQVRPSWMVAGVDYAVGVPSGATLIDWESLSGPGISVNTSTHVVTVSGQSGVTISNVDFSLHGGATLYFSNSPNAVVTDCDFGGTNLTTIPNSVIYADKTSSGLTVKYSTIDGGGAGSGSSLIADAAGGTITLEYNWFKNFPQHVFESTITNAATDFAIVYEYNLIENGAKSAGSHLNYLQLNGGTATSITVAYNTSLQTEQVSAGEGFQFYGNAIGGPATSVNNVTVTNNTMIATATGGPGNTFGVAMSLLIHGDNALPGGTTPVISNNFFDISSAYGAFYTSSLSGWSVTNNVDMNTGKLIEVNNSEVPATWTPRR